MYARRRRRYFTMMAICLVLFVSAWAFVRLWSVPAAIAMCAVAMVIPPLAAITANKREADDRWWDEPPPEPREAPGDQRREETPDRAREGTRDRARAETRDRARAQTSDRPRRDARQRRRRGR